MTPAELLAKARAYKASDDYAGFLILRLVELIDGDKNMSVFADEIKNLEAERKHWEMTAGTLRTDLEYMTRERDAALAECERIKDPLLKDMRFEDGTLNLSLTGEILERMALIVGEHFVASGAKNYIEMQLHDRKNFGVRYAISIQKCGDGAKTPHELKTEAIARAEQAEARLAEYERFYSNPENWKREKELDANSGNFTGGPAAIRKGVEPAP